MVDTTYLFPINVYENFTLFALVIFKNFCGRYCANMKMSYSLPVFTGFSILIPGWKGCHIHHQKRLGSSQVYYSFQSFTIWNMGCCKLHYRNKKVNNAFQTLSYALFSPSVLTASNKEKTLLFLQCWEGNLRLLSSWWCFPLMTNQTIIFKAKFWW